MTFGNLVTGKIRDIAEDRSNLQAEIFTKRGGAGIDCQGEHGRSSQSFAERDEFRCREPLGQFGEDGVHRGLLGQGRLDKADDDGEAARGPGNLGAGEAVGVAGAVEALVVGADDLADVGPRIDELEPFEAGAGELRIEARVSKTGNAIAAPVLAYSPNNASADLPGTIGLSTDVFKQMNKEIAEQLIKQGFKNVMLMGDHGGGQAQLGEVATELDAKYSPEGIHVYFISDAYAKAQGDFEKWLADNGYPCAGHAGIPDTSEMMYLGLDKGWVRKELIATAVGNYQQCAGKPVDEAAAARPRVNNGITGDARRSTV